MRGGTGDLQHKQRVLNSHPSSPSSLLLPPSLCQDNCREVIKGSERLVGDQVDLEVREEGEDRDGGGRRGEITALSCRSRLPQRRRSALLHTDLFIPPRLASPRLLGLRTAAALTCASCRRAAQTRSSPTDPSTVHFLNLFGLFCK